MNQIKYFFSFFSISLLLFGFSNCGSSQGKNTVTFEENPSFAISEIYSQDWISGTREGGSGTNLYITFQDISGDVVIEQLFFRNKTEEAKRARNNPNVFTGYFKNETSRDAIMDSNPEKEAQNTPPNPFPFNLKENEAVIRYKVNEDTKFFKVSEIAQRPTIAYPSANPNGID